MAKKVEHKDIIEEGIFNDTIEGAERLLNSIKELKTGFKDLLIDSRNVKLKGAIGDSKDLDKLNKALVENAKIRSQLEKLRQQEAILNEKIAQQRLKTTAQEFKNEQQLAKAIEQEEKARAKKNQQLENENRAYVKLSKQLNEMKKQVKDLLASEKELTEEDKKLIAETQELDKRLKAIDKTVGDTQRNVGNYADSIKEAFQETGLFNGGIGQIINSLKNLKDQFAKSSEQGGKFSNTLKIGLVGGIAVAIAGLKELATVNAGLAQFFDKAGAAIGGFITGGVAGAKASLDFKNALYETQIQLRALSLELQQISLDEDDFKEISSDVTIGFKERNEALKQSIELSKRRAAINSDIARKELALIDKQVKAANVGLRSVSPELLDKQAEAKRKLNDALDQEADLTRQNAALSRQRAVEEAVAAVELLRSKKLSFDEQSAILQKQLQDEKNQIEERRKIAGQLLSEQNKTTQEEIKLFKEKSKIQFDAQDILNEKDAVNLANKLKSIQQLNEENELVGIGEQAIQELAKIVKEYQENRIANSDAIKKLDEEEIKRQQKIASINSEIAALQLADQIKSIEDAVNFSQETNEENFDKLLQETEVFNRKLRDKINIQKKFIQDNEEDIYNLKVTQLINLAEAEKKAIEESENDEKIKAAKILAVNEKLQIDLGKLDAETRAKKIAADKKEADDKKKISAKQRETIAKEAQEGLDFISNALDARSQKLQETLDKEIGIRQNEIDRQRELAEKGLDNQLAFEEQKLAEAELRREDEKVKEVRRQKVFAYLSALTEFAKKDPNSAPFKALAMIAISEAISGSFKDGVENMEGPGTETSDSILARLSKGESVVTASATKEAPGLVTAWNEGKLEDYLKENYSPMLMTETGSTASNMGNSAMLHQLVGVNKRLQSLEKAIVGKKETQINWDSHGNFVAREVEAGVARTIKYVKQKPRI